MTSIIIGDLHGRNVWEGIPKLETYDRIVFLGDYFDPKEDISDESQLDNFKKVLDLKDSFPEKVVLLTGNHDYHYFPFAKSQFSGFSKIIYKAISDLFQERHQAGMFEAAVLIDQFLVSHAGITKTWFRNYLGNPEVLSLEEIKKAVCSAWLTHPDSFAFVQQRGASQDGDDVFQSPFMVRPNSMLLDAIPDCIHVVGHTPVEKITKKGQNLLLCDTLGNSRAVLKIQDAGFSVMEF